MKHPRRWILSAVFALLAVSAVIALIPVIREQRNAQLLADAREALRSGDVEEAEALSRQILARAPDNEAARLVAGDAAIAQKAVDRAEEHLRPLLRERNRDALALLPSLAEQWMKSGDFDVAESLFELTLRYEPDQAYARKRLVLLLSVQGRWWEAYKTRFPLLQSRQHDEHDLLFLGNPQAILLDEDVEQLWRVAPDYPPVQLGQARFAMSQLQFDEAERLLRHVDRERPDMLAARIQLGKILAGRPDPNLIVQWHADLPPDAFDHPDTWLILGLWYRDRNQLEPAIRCFAEAITRDPNHLTAMYQLSLALGAAGETELAARLGERVELLRQLVAGLDSLNQRVDDVDLLRRTADLCEALGRLWEAWGWQNLILQIDPSDITAIEAATRLESQLTESLGVVAETALPSQLTDWSRFALPAGPERVDRVPEAPTKSNLEFRNVAAELGLVVRPAVSATPDEGRLMPQTTGAGVAVLDYDNDGWPDLYFSQGLDSAVDTENGANRLFRNVRGRGFVDVTEQAGVGDTGFGQGVAAGDFDHDGWPDILVANVGNNRLYHNKGDGTFAEVGAAAGMVSDAWTASCALADINSDGHVDLLEINYLSGPDALTQRCIFNRVRRACLPGAFPSAPDVVWLGRGDGTFAKLASPEFDARGLGLLVADFSPNTPLASSVRDVEGSETAGLEVMVANVVGPDFLWRMNSGNANVFERLGRVCGIAFDKQGIPLGSKGLATADFNADGMLDIVVTGSLREANLLFLQGPSGYYREASTAWGLAESGAMMVSFGVQSLDADLDGFPDLIVANGHFDDYRMIGLPYELPTQVFQNRNGMRFERRRSVSEEGYLAENHVGRAVVRVDFDRDGRDDAVVTHLDEPAALLRNETESAGQSLRLHLRGTVSPRIPVGALVRVRGNFGERISTLARGDGYMAGNESRLTVGLGPAAEIHSVNIRWPSGSEQSVEGLTTDREWLIVEDTKTPVPLGGNK